MTKTFIFLVPVLLMTLGCKKAEDTPLTTDSEAHEVELLEIEGRETIPDGVNGKNSQQTAVENRPLRSRIEPGLSFAGMPDIETLERFLETVRSAARADDRDAIASLIFYPYTVNSDETIYTLEQFLDAYDRIISPESQKILETMDVSTFWGNWRGGNVHSGAVWFNTYEGETKINYISR